VRDSHGAVSRFGIFGHLSLLVLAPPLFPILPIILRSVQTAGLMTREVSAPSQAFDDNAAASSISRRYYDGARARRLGVLYASGFLFVATVRLLHDSGYSSSSSYDSFAAPQPSQLQVVFRQSLNGASRPYLRCRLGDHAVTATTAGEGTQDATTSGSPIDETSTVASPGSLGGSEEEVTSLEDDPFNQVEGSKSRRYRGEKTEPHRTPPSSRSRKHGRSRSARSARSKETASERGRMT
jgi:hypothetical protein